MKTPPLTTNTVQKPRVTRGNGNIFADLGFAPREAAELKVKAELTLQIYQQIARSDFYSDMRKNGVE